MGAAFTSTKGALRRPMTSNSHPSQSSLDDFVTLSNTLSRYPFDSLYSSKQQVECSRLLSHLFCHLCKRLLTKVRQLLRCDWLHLSLVFLSDLCKSSKGLDNYFFMSLSHSCLAVISGLSDMFATLVNCSLDPCIFFVFIWTFIATLSQLKWAKYLAGHGFCFIWQNGIALKVYSFTE